MIVVGNKVITTPVKDIVETLQQQLFLLHINKLDKVEFRQRDIRVTCPVHGGGHERTPSCDILLEDKVDSSGKTIPAGTVSCFACGFKGNLVKFIAECLNTSYQKACEWILNSSSYNLLETTREIDMLDGATSAIVKLPTITLEELKSYDYVHEYMFQRKLTWEIIQKFDVGYDPKLNAITFPVWVNGECLFVCKRRVDFKRFDMPSISPKPIYGLDYITDKEVIVCESIFNALTCWVYGKQAIALFGTGSEYQIEQLKRSGIRSFVLAFDGDGAGKKATCKFKKALSDFAVVTEMQLPEKKDINDLSKEEFDNLYANRSWF